MRRWAYRRVLSTALAIASATLFLAAAATVFSVAHVAGSAARMLADPRGSAAAASVLAGTLSGAQVPDEQGVGAAQAVLASPELSGALAQAAATGDGAQLTSSLTAAALPVDGRFAHPMTSMVERLTPGRVAPPVMARSPAAWALGHTDALVPVGGTISAALLVLLLIWKARSTARSVGHWALGFAGVWLMLVVAAPAVVLHQTSAAAWVLGALAVRHLASPLVMPLLLMFSAGLGVTIAASWRPRAAPGDPASQRVAKVPKRRLPTVLGWRSAHPAPASAPASLPDDRAPAATSPGSEPTPESEVAVAAVGSECFDPAMGSP